MPIEPLHPAIESRFDEITSAFNSKAGKGIELINQICSDNKLDASQQMASFLTQQSKETNKRRKLTNDGIKNVSEYVSSVKPQAKLIREALIDSFDLSNKEVMPALRQYLDNIQKIILYPIKDSYALERMGASFAESYSKQNPNSKLSLKEVDLLITYAMGLTQGLHNPKVDKVTKAGLTLKNVTNMVTESNGNKPLEPKIMENFYADLKAKPIKFIDITKTTFITKLKNTIENIVKNIKQVFSIPKSKGSLSSALGNLKPQGQKLSNPSQAPSHDPQTTQNVQISQTHPLTQQQTPAHVWQKPNLQKTAEQNKSGMGEHRTSQQETAQPWQNPNLKKPEPSKIGSGEHRVSMASSVQPPPTQEPIKPQVKADSASKPSPSPQLASSQNAINANSSQISANHNSITSPTKTLGSNVGQLVKKFSPEPPPNHTTLSSNVKQPMGRNIATIISKFNEKGALPVNPTPHGNTSNPKAKSSITR